MEKFSQIISKFLINAIKAIPFVPRIIIKQTTNISKNYKRKRSIVCLFFLVAGAGSGATLSIINATVNAYIGGIAFAFLPFLNSSAENAAIGILGGFIGASIGFNLAKSVFRQYSLVKNGYSNAALIFDRSTAMNIINANPVLFSNEAALINHANSNQIAESEHEVVIEELGENAQNVESILWMLRETRRKMMEYKEDGTHRKRYLKYGLLSAIRSYDLMPLQEMIVFNFWKREIRIKEFSRMMEMAPEQIYSNLQKRVEELSNKDVIFPNWYSNDVSRPLQSDERVFLFGKIKCLIEKLRGEHNQETIFLPGNIATKERFYHDYLRNI